jgi:multidrug resistance efflux pump
MAEQTSTQTDPTQAAPESDPPEQGPTEQVAPEPAAPAGRRPFKRGTKIRLIMIGAIALIIALAFVIYYVVDSRNYVTTNNAQVDGNQISIVAPATGTLIGWKGHQGTEVQSYQPIGRVAIQAGYSQPQVVIRAPGAGTIAVDNGVEGGFVTAGTPLAVAYDSGGVFVTARVDETEVDAVHPGASVKIDVDAFPDAHLTGQVAEVKTGAAGVFSLFPQSNTTGNFQKVTQVIPVKITIDDLLGLALAPGMSVTVKIRRG